MTQHTSHNLETTLSIIKPDAVAQNQMGNIIEYFEKGGLHIIAAKMVHLTKSQAHEFYKIHASRPFFESLVEFMTSGPCFVMVLEGNNAVARTREIMGPTDPNHAAPGSIRGDFGTNIEHNAIHGSDALSTAQQEIKFFFEPNETFHRS